MLRTALTFCSAALLSACVSHQGRPTNGVAPTTQSDFTVTRDVTYSPEGWPQPLAADLYVPNGSGPFPAVVVVHGGGWTRRTRADMDSISEGLARRGFVAMNVSYRLAPGAHFPAQLHDLQQAVIWLRAHAAAYKVRGDRIGAWGYSAGAHLAALLALTGEGDKYFAPGSQVSAVVAGGTPADLRYYPDGPLPNALMGVSIADNPEVWREASPVALVKPNDPPFFLYHGTWDFTVGVNNADELFNVLNANDVPAEYYRVTGLEHFSMFYWPPMDSATEFLRRHLD